MDETTDYVHTAVINYEPTYQDLSHCAAMHSDREEPTGLDELAEILQDCVRENWAYFAACGMTEDDLRGVNFAAMIEWEASNG